MKQYYVYIISSYNKKVLYIGVTSNLVKRIYEHKNEIVEGFSKKYKIKYLVYYEITGDIESAIKREKQLKNWRREKKETLICKMNPSWKDLYQEII
jgi:putative endonuclease